MKKNVKDIFETNKQRILVLSSIFSLLVAVALFSYAMVTVNYEGLNTNKIATCSLDISLKEEDPIRLLEQYPMNYNQTLDYAPFKFSISSNESNCNKVSYKIAMESACKTCSGENNICNLGSNYTCNCNDNYQIDSKFIDYELKNTRTNQVFTGTDINLLTEVFTIDSGVTDTYELKLWINENATNEDLYVYENGKVVENSDGSYETKNYCGKITANVYVLESGDITKGCKILTSSLNTKTDRTLTLVGLNSSLDTNPYSFDGINFGTNNVLEVTENGTYYGYVKNSDGSIDKCSIDVTGLTTIKD